jgi:hypothetical protein
MKRLDTFLEGLLSKSNKTKVMGTKELILSTIEDRLDNVNTNLAKDLMMDVVDRIVNTYKRFRGEVKISRTPQCFISIYKNSTRTWLYFSWLEKNRGNTYWMASWSLADIAYNRSGILVGLQKGDTYQFNKMCLIGTYEVPVEDMKEYLAKVENTIGRNSAYAKLVPDRDSKIDKFIKHILSWKD